MTWGLALVLASACAPEFDDPAISADDPPADALANGDEDGRGLPVSGAEAPSEAPGGANLYPIEPERREAPEANDGSPADRPATPPPVTEPVPQARLREEPVRGRNVVFSFDDGPGPNGEEDALLSLLARTGVKAILFPTGRWTEGRAAWLAQARAAGQLVCNHTYQHRDLRRLPEPLLREQITRGAGHGTCDILRPPYGGFDGRVAAVARELGYRILLWDVDSRDWEGASPQAIYDHVVGRARPGSVVLFHIQARTTLTALPAIVENLRAAGYVLSYDPGDVAPEPFVIRTFVSGGLRAFAFAAAPTYLPNGTDWWRAPRGSG